MARFTLIERQGTGVEVRVPDRGSNPQEVGDELLIIDRQLEDRNGNLVGTFVSRCTIVGFAQGDLVVAFTATNKLNKGMINTQGAMRFADFALPKGVTFGKAEGRDLRHCRRNPQVQEGSRHGDREIRCPRHTVHLQGLLGRRLIRLIPGRKSAALTHR
jgi:hypothetical protein